MRASPDVVEADFIASMVKGMNLTWCGYLTKKMYDNHDNIKKKVAAMYFGKCDRFERLCVWCTGPLGPLFCLSVFIIRFYHSSVEAMATSGEGMSEAWEQLAATWVQMESLGLKSPVVNMSSQLWTLVVVQIGVFRHPQLVSTRGIVPGSGVGEGNLKDIFGFYCDQERH